MFTLSVFKQKQHRTKSQTIVVVKIFYSILLFEIRINILILDFI